MMASKDRRFLEAFRPQTIPTSPTAGLGKFRVVDHIKGLAARRTIRLELPTQ